MYKYLIKSKFVQIFDKKVESFQRFYNPNKLQQKTEPSLGIGITIQSEVPMFEYNYSLKLITI